MQWRGISRLATAVLTAAILAACSGDKGDSEQSGRPMVEDQTRVSELKRVDLDNGIVLYMQEEHTDNRVAVEFFYPAGFVRDPAGRVQMAHLVEHVRMFAATENYETGQAVDEIRRYGLLGAQAQANCVHFDYLVPADSLSDLMQMESERLTSMHLDAQMVADQTERALSELETIMSEENRAVTRFAIMALTQVICHGRSNVPIENEPWSITPEQIMEFCNTYYRPDDMVIVMVGGFDMAEGERLVRQYFDSIPRRPAPPPVEISLPEDVNATWDIDANAFFLVFPGPYEEARERIALSMFGSYFRKYISQVSDVQYMYVSVYCSSPVYPVGDMPFFIYGQPAPRYPATELQVALEELLDAAIDRIDERMLSAIKQNAKGYMESSSIGKIQEIVEREKVLGGEATGIGFKHFFREDMSNDELYALIDSITLDDMRLYIDRYLSQGNKKVVTFSK